MALTKSQFPHASILIVDDEELNIRLLERMLQAGGFTKLQSTQDSRQVMSLMESFQPDLVLLDLNMPHLDGFAVLEQITPTVPEDQFLPVLMLTADATAAARDRALAGGAHDFLTKPFDHTEVLLRIANLLKMRSLQAQLARHNAQLEGLVQERTAHLEDSYASTLKRLSRIAEFRDDDTYEHTERVGAVSSAISAQLGWSTEQVEIMRKAAPLHDVGKIGTPDAILLKPGALTDDEFEVMREHITMGSRILTGSRSPVLQMADAIALAHHERWDGNGYLRMEGTDIPLAARIVTVADVYDALTHARPYKEAWPIDRAMAEIKAQRGRQFDPDVLDAFLVVQATLT